MAKGRPGVFTYRQIVIRLRAGDGPRRIARDGLACRQLVRRVRDKAREAGWLDPLAEPPTDEQVAELFGDELVVKVPAQASSVEPFRTEVEAWVKSGISATTIYEALKRDRGFTGSYGSVLRFVQRVRPSEPEAFVPLHFEPGQVAQVDFGSGPVLPHPDTGEPTRTHIFVMTLAFSRHMYAEIVWNQKVSTWLRCHRNAFEFFGGVVTRVVIDNLKAAITRACFQEPEVQRSYEEFAEGYGFIISPCRPRTPRHKGRVEAGVKYVKGSFVPTRSFRSLGDANQQLLEWVLGQAGNRTHGTTHQVPLTMFADIEKASLKALPQTPPELIVWSKATLHSNCHVTFEKSFYSAPYRLVHKELLIRASDHLVEIYHDNRAVALHSRAKRPGQWLTVEAHLPPEKVAYMNRTPQWCLRRADDVGEHCLAVVRRLFAHKVLDRLPAVQGIIRLGDKYGKSRLEDACHRALAFENVSYHAIKRILEQGLDQAPLDEEEGGQLNFGFIESPRFSRNLATMLTQ